MKKTVLALLGLFILALQPSTTQAKQLDVVVSIKPIHSLVASVMGNKGTPRLLLQGSVDPHIFHMRPSQINKVINADLLFLVDPRLEEFLASTIKRKPRNLKIVTLAEDKDIQLYPFRTGKIWTEASHDHKDGHHHEGMMDLHIWLDPINARRIVNIIEEALSELDPDNRVYYIRNAQRLRKRLYEIEERLRDDLRPLRQRPMIVFHDAFQYFERAFSLKSVGTVQLTSDQPPSAAHIRTLKEVAKDNDVACVLGTPGSHPRIATTIIRDTKAGYGTVDPLGIYLDEGPSLYFELIEEIAMNILECQDGSNELLNPDSLFE